MELLKGMLLSEESKKDGSNIGSKNKGKSNKY